MIDSDPIGNSCWDGGYIGQTRAGHEILGDRSCDKRYMYMATLTVLAGSVTGLTPKSWDVPRAVCGRRGKPIPIAFKDVECSRRFQGMTQQQVRAEVYRVMETKIRSLYRFWPSLNPL